MKKKSLPSKVAQLKPGETMILLTDNYPNFMRGIESCMSRQLMEKVSYKKAQVIIDDILYIGVAITKI